MFVRWISLTQRLVYAEIAQRLSFQPSAQQTIKHTTTTIPAGNNKFGQPVSSFKLQESQTFHYFCLLLPDSLKDKKRRRISHSQSH